MADSICCSPSPPPDAKKIFKLPSKYTFLKVLGEGGFGQVVKCWEEDTQNTVAVKIPKRLYDTSKENSMLKKFMQLNFDQQNIVKFLGSFHMECGRALVFETLDISLEGYLFKTQCAPMDLSDIRTIIQQVATAFNALKNVRVIHTDIKPDNIMLVNHHSRPFRVKLIDFGLAMHRSKAKQGRTLQTVPFRSPEIVLGLPFSEAIDMWSLGCVMTIMMVGDYLFPAYTEYEALQFITKLLGQPADHLLDEGQKTHLFFNKTESNSWRLKTLQEYQGVYRPSYDEGVELQSLDDLRRMRPMRKTKAEAEDLEQCIELLMAMIKIDETERITPSEVLTHPFIAKDHHSSCWPPSSLTTVCPGTATGMHQMDVSLQNSMSNTSRSGALVPMSEDFECGRPATALKEDDTTNIHPGHRSPTPTIPSPTIPSSGVIMVQPAAVENTHQIEDQESAVSLQNCVNKTSRSEALVSISEDFDCGPPATALNEDDTTNIHLDNHSPSPAIPPSGVIIVQPAAAKNTLQIEDQESAVSLQNCVNKTSRSEALVSISEDFDCGPSATALNEDDTTNIHPDNRSPSPAIPSSGVIIVQPAAAKNTLQIEDQESAVSLQTGLNQTSKSSVKVIESNAAAWIPDDSTTCDDPGTKTKKKKNRIRRIFSWMKKTFCSCWTCVDEDEERL